LLRYKRGLKNDLHSIEYDEITSTQCESLWCKVYVSQVDFIVVGVCYRSQEADENEISQLFECIKTVTDLKCPALIMGDFNYPGINWSTLKADSEGSKFLKLVLDCYLDQHVHEPTRMKNILDLVLTSDLQLKDDVRITAPVGNSDHNGLIWETESIKK